jgi:hypothetical protein
MPLPPSLHEFLVDACPRCDSKVKDFRLLTKMPDGDHPDHVPFSMWEVCDDPWHEHEMPRLQ